MVRLVVCHLSERRSIQWNHTCRFRESYRHLVMECSYSWENMSKIKTSVEEEHMLMFTRNNFGDCQQYGFWKLCNTGQFLQ